MIYAKVHKTPVILELRDITYTQMAATSGTYKSLSEKLMKWLELSLCKHANHIVVVTNGFKRILYSEGIPEEKISVITNGVNISNDGSKHHVIKIGKKMTIGYFGTLGISQDLLQTFKYIKKIGECIPQPDYLIIGDGAEKEVIEKEIKQSGYEFIKMLPSLASSKLEPYYENVDICLISLKNNDLFRDTIPSKIFQIMGRGIPLIYIGPSGEASQIIDTNRVGITLTGTIHENYEKIRNFFNDPSYPRYLSEMGMSGQETVRKYYTRTSLACKYLEIIEELEKNKLTIVQANKLI
jgi:glycosyltransferase involved in cell wall biosynthesis